MIEIRDKKTGTIREQSIEAFLAESSRGTKGKLNDMIGLASGAIYQNLKCCWRLKGLSDYEWDWSK